MKTTLSILLTIMSMSLLGTAGPLIDNTYQPPYGLVPDVFSGQWVAAPFQTGSDPAQLNSVSLYEFTFGAPAGSFFVSVYGDNNGLPGPLLPSGVLSGPSAPQGAGLQTYTASQPLSLAANTLYWVVASSDGGSLEDLYGWGAAAVTGYTSSVGWNFFDSYASTTDQGASWFMQNLGAGPQLLEINGTLVPEPTTLGLLGLGAGSVLFLRRNKMLK